MKAQFKRLLEENLNLPLIEQKEILRSTLSEWMGEAPQIDDIVLTGIKIN